MVAAVVTVAAAAAVMAVAEGEMVLHKQEVRELVRMPTTCANGALRSHPLLTWHSFQWPWPNTGPWLRDWEPLL